MTRPKPKAAKAMAPSTPRVQPGCLIAAAIRSSPLCPAGPYGDRVGLGVFFDRFEEWIGDRFFQPGHPFLEFFRRLDDDFGPHRGVAEAAELGADQLVGADPRS